MTQSDGEGAPKGRTGLVVGLLAMFAFGGYAAYNFHQARRVDSEAVAERPARPVATAAVKRETMERWLTLTGEVRPWREVHVFAKIAGQTIETLPVEKGQQLAAGQLVATLDRTTVDARLAEGQAALAAAEAAREQAEANLGLLVKDRLRLQRLVAENAVARQRLDHMAARTEAAAAALRLAEARVAQAEAALKQLRIVSNDHRVTAPIAGTVIARLFDAGNLSSTDRPLIRMADERRVKVVTFVSEADRPALRPGTPAEVRVDAHPERVFHSTVARINAAFDPATRNTEVEIELENADGLLSTGMYARVRLLRDRIDVLAVDREALTRMPGTGSDTVFAVDDGRAVQVNVETGVRDEQRVEVTRGLTAGMAVVVRGQGGLRDGDRVTVAAGSEHGRTREPIE